ncbi:hypothetical protein BC941DRAFT_472085 [Chlamydoabsidia padenii]|nr:hypothetical protein BC941DRAFT_472085 [Chlamydoabsidia padenii]
MPASVLTPASAPLTTPSNNAFYPPHLPQHTKARLTLDELDQVLTSTKHMLHHLQQVYIDPSSKNVRQRLGHLTQAQIKLTKAITLLGNNKKKSSS